MKTDRTTFEREHLSPLGTIQVTEDMHMTCDMQAFTEARDEII